MTQKQERLYIPKDSPLGLNLLVQLSKKKYVTPDILVKNLFDEMGLGDTF